MRKLTIVRRKSIVASLMKVKIYLEDSLTNEFTINGIKCKKVGDISNGKEISFEIPNTSIKVFAIIDKISSKFCNGFYIIPEGEDDITIYGKNKFSPFKGNPFIFEK